MNPIQWKTVVAGSTVVLMFLLGIGNPAYSQRAIAVRHVEMVGLERNWQCKSSEMPQRK